MISLVFLNFEGPRKIVSNGELGLEVNPDHRAQLEVDEQQQDVIDLDVTLLDHQQKLRHRRPGSDCSDGEQRQVMERLNEQVAQRSGQLMDVLAKLFSPIDIHGSSSLGRLDR